MATISEIQAVAIRDFGGRGSAPNISPAPESQGFINFGLANQTKPIKEIIYNFLGFNPPSEVVPNLPDITANASGQPQYYFQTIADNINAEIAKIKNAMPVEIPKLNDTAASPNALTLGLPTILVIAGIVGLFILGRKN